MATRLRKVGEMIIHTSMVAHKSVIGTAAYALLQGDGAAFLAERHSLGGGLGGLGDSWSQLLVDMAQSEHGALAEALDATRQSVVLDLGHSGTLEIEDMQAAINEREATREATLTD
jgi:hypothetical protein